MAITWGSAELDGSNGLRIGYELTQSPGSVGQGTSSVTVTLKLYVGTRRSVFDSTNSWSISGDFDDSGSVNISHSSSTSWSGANVTRIVTLSKSVNTSYSGTVKTDFSASLSGVEAVPGTVHVSGSITTARRPYQNPAVPTGASVSRVSDTQMTVTWDNHGTSSAPYHNVTVDRWDNVGDKWSLVAKIGNVESYTDRSTRIDRRYRYRIGAQNSSGTAGDWSYSNYIATTPDPPSALTAVKTSGGDIRLNWTNHASYGTGIEVWHAEDGVWEGTRMILLGGTSPNQPTTYTHNSPDPTKTHQYRLKAVTSGPTIYGPYSGASNVVQLLTNPNAPTNLAPSSTTRDAAADLVLTWQHNEVDGTEQTGYDVRYRLDGGAWVTLTDLTSDVEQRTIVGGTFANGQTFEWQVRTYGLYAVAPAYSPWSTTAVVILSTPPTVLIQTPEVGVPVDNSVLTVDWAYFDAEGHAQSQWRIVLVDAFGNIVETRSGAGATETTTFSTTITDGGTYTVTAQVRDSTGLWSEVDEVIFTVEYPLPPKPSVAASWDPDTGTVIVSITNGVTEVGQADAVSNDVWRSIDGQDWGLVATGVALNTAITDYIPGLNAENFYKATAISSLPSLSESEPVSANTTDHRHWVWINSGPGFSAMVHVRDNAKVSAQGGREKTLQRFQGRTKPVEFVGEQRNQEISLTARFAPDSSTPADVRFLADLPAPACVRTPDGQRYFVSTGQPSISYAGVTAELSWSMTEVDYSE